MRWWRSGPIASLKWWITTGDGNKGSPQGSDSQLKSAITFTWHSPPAGNLLWHTLLWWPPFLLLLLWHFRVWLYIHLGKRVDSSLCRFLLRHMVSVFNLTTLFNYDQPKESNNQQDCEVICCAIFLLWTSWRGHTATGSFLSLQNQPFTIFLKSWRIKHHSTLSICSITSLFDHWRNIT